MSAMRPTPMRMNRVWPTCEPLMMLSGMRSFDTACRRNVSVNDSSARKIIEPTIGPFTRPTPPRMRQV